MREITEKFVVYSIEELEKHSPKGFERALSDCQEWLTNEWAMSYENEVCQNFLVEHGQTTLQVIELDLFARQVQLEGLMKTPEIFQVMMALQGRNIPEVEVGQYPSYTGWNYYIRSDYAFELSESEGDQLASYKKELESGLLRAVSEIYWHYSSPGSAREVMQNQGHEYKADGSIYFS